MPRKAGQIRGPLSDAEVNRIVEQHTPIALWCMHRVYGERLDHPTVKRLGGTDAVKQDALIALWRAARAYQPGKGDFPPYAFSYVCKYLYHVSSHEWTHHVRVPPYGLKEHATLARAFPLRCIGFERAVSEASGEPSPLEQAMLAEQCKNVKDRVMELFDALNPQQVFVLKARLFEDKPYSAIAECFGVTRQAAELQFKNALRIAREILCRKDGKCLTQSCNGVLRSRGLCHKCWSRAWWRVKNGKTTWPALVRDGLAGHAKGKVHA